MANVAASCVCAAGPPVFCPKPPVLVSVVLFSSAVAADGRRTWARARGRTGMTLAAAIMQRSVPRPERMRGEMPLHNGSQRGEVPPSKVSTPTPHTSTAHAQPIAGQGIRVGLS
eukprot:3681459-Prymnesium_polylepis.2